MSKSPETINVDHAFDPQLRNAQADFDAYLGTRPYEDVNGSLHHPDTGNFISKDTAEGFYHDSTELNNDDLYANKSLNELVRMSAEAEVAGDKTTRLSVDEELFSRLQELQDKYADDYVERDGTLRDESEFDKVYNRIDKLHRKYVDLYKKGDSYDVNLPGDNQPIDVNEKTKKVEIPAPDENINAWKSKIELENALHLDKSWLEKTGEWDKDPGKPPKASLTQAWVKANKDKLENQIDDGVDENEEGDFGHRYDEELQDWVPHGPNLDDYMDDEESDANQIPSAELIRWADDEEDDNIVINPAGPAAVASVIDSDSWFGDHEGQVSPEGRDTRPENQERNKYSRRKKLAAALIGLASVVGIGTLIYSATKDSDSDRAPVETDADGTSPLDLSEANDEFDESPSESESPLDMSSAIGAFDVANEDDSEKSDEVSEPQTGNESEDAEDNGESKPDGDDDTEPQPDENAEESAEEDTEANDEANRAPTAPTSTTEVLTLENAVGVENFETESGSGFVKEIRDFAQANNVEISNEQAFALYQAMLDTLGPNGMITGSTYEISPGNIGISNPGASTWTDEAAQFIIDRLPVSELPGTK